MIAKLDNSPFLATDQQINTSSGDPENAMNPDESLQSVRNGLSSHQRKFPEK